MEAFSQDTPPVLLTRAITPLIQESMRYRPVLLLQGARQTGKTTLARSLVPQQRYFTLDDSIILRSAKADPDGWIASLQGSVVIDAIQRAPELFRSIKLQVDIDRRPGRFFLTGSAQPLMLPNLSESLAGRMAIFTLYPLSQGEIGNTQETFLERLFSDQTALMPNFPEAQGNWVERALLGGYPEAMTIGNPSVRARWYTDYIQAIVLRDIQELARIEGLSELPMLLQILASRAGGLINFSDLARSLKLSQPTLKRYITLLETTFLIHLLPAWHTRTGQNLTKMPKIYLSDTGLLAHLGGLNQERLMQDGFLRGAFLENFVCLEILKQVSYASNSYRLSHYRAHTQQEVDFVLENNAGELVGIEVKASSAISPGDLKGMHHLKEGAGKKFVRGIVLYCGSKALPLASQISAWPIHWLWSSS